MNAKHSSTASSTLTNAGGESCQECPAGTFSPSPASSPNPQNTASENTARMHDARPRALSPGTVFREDYRKRGRISYLEAADYAGVTVRTVQNWICRGKNPLPVCARAGSYRINLIDLEKFLQRGF